MTNTLQLIIREPKLSDATAISHLIRQSPPLDVNSHYSTLLLCQDFYSTCVVAECDSVVVGFLSAYLPPTRNATVFVWQVAVHEKMRSHGLASQMLDALLSRDICSEVQYLETTITPSNSASQNLFRSFARRLDTECHKHIGFSAEMFPDDESHEPEELFRIGPFIKSQ